MKDDYNILKAEGNPYESVLRTKYGEFYYWNNDRTKVICSEIYVEEDKVVLELEWSPLEKLTSRTKLLPYQEGLDLTEHFLDMIKKERQVIIRPKRQKRKNQ